MEPIGNHLSRLITLKTSIGKLPPRVIQDRRAIAVSPDSRRVAFVSEEEGNHSLLLYGPGPSDQSRIAVAGQIGICGCVFSADSQHVAYHLVRGGKENVVVDGREGLGYDAVGDEIVFSPDSQHVAYGAMLGDRYFVLLDGVEQHGYSAVRSIRFSPDSQRLAYIATESKRQFAVVDGVEEERYDAIWALTFRPDSQTVAYFARRGITVLLVIGGLETRCPRLLGPQIAFSPNSQRIAYIKSAWFGMRWCAVVDSSIGKSYTSIGETTGILFSPDSLHVAYFAKRHGRWGVILDGVEQRQYEGIASLAFSPDSKHVAFLAQHNVKWRIVVDFAESDTFDAFVQGAQVLFDDSSHVHCLMVDMRNSSNIEDWEIYLVEAKLS